MNIGLTGGIATGKSTVSAMLVKRGAVLVDADRIAREVVLPGSSVLDKIVERFGQAVLHEDGTLNRKALGGIIFRDTADRKALEEIMHPAIRKVMIDRMQQYEKECPDRLVVVDVPLLFESGLQSLFLEVMVVYAPKSVQIDRLMVRDGLAEEEACQRLNAQMDIEDKRKLADIVIHNGGDLDETERQIEQFWLRKGLQ